MNAGTEMDNLFDEVIGVKNSKDQASVTNDSLPAIQAVSKKLEKLLNLQLPALLQSAVNQEKLKAQSRRVDGQIIGTGAADFTKGNTLYTLNYKGKSFQLIDVPGIEGDESKYAHMVREAVAKAHLVFYVNGTNKKPEKATAEKIRSYLRRGTQVCPLINIRGSADAYEEEGDRDSLTNHSGAEANLKQTVGVLQAVLGENVLLPGHCVQGLLAFSSLAVSSQNDRSSIHPSREDLLTHQHNYRKYFKLRKAMFDFSQVKAVAQVLHFKLGTFRDDIIESNKAKVRELLVENIEVLQMALKEHQTFIARVKPEFEKCRDSISEAMRTFERLVTEGRKNLWSKFFNDFTEKADVIIATHFGDNDLISAELTKVFKTLQSGMGASLNGQAERYVEALGESLNNAMQRLVQDVRRVEFQQRITFDEGGQKVSYRAAELDMELGLKGWSSIALNVGNYALSGARLGTPFGGPVGAAIGAAIGAVVGVLVSVMHFFTNKETRIRKAQAQMQEKIEEVRKQVENGLADEMKSLMEPVRKEVKESTLSQVAAMHTSLISSINLIEQQMALMIRIKNQLEKMPHGTIQTI